MRYKFLVFAILFGCSNYDDRYKIPDVYVYKKIYLNNPSNKNLRFSGGWLYFEGGINGIIVYNVDNETFNAYERSCPHKSLQDCSKLLVKSDNITIECVCDNSRFLILNGMPLEKSPIPLKKYTVRYEKSKNVLYISN